MGTKTVVETIHGKYSKFEIVKDSGLLGSPKFYIRKNGQAHRGSFSSLSAAVAAARKEAGG